MKRNCSSEANDALESRLEHFMEELAAAVPSARVSTSHGDRHEHGHDESAYPEHLPDIVIWPRTTAEVSAMLRLANEKKIPVTPWGAGTSLEGNCIPLHGGIVLDFRQMDDILAIHANDFQVTVQPGVMYKDMNSELGRKGLFFAPDPGANATIGGMLANNAAGVRTVKYGATKENVLALEVVLANGVVVRTGSRSVKQSSGYDLTHLFVGSEGTLGVITEATLKLAPIPQHLSAVIAAFPSTQAVAETVFEVMAYGLEPSAMELLDILGVRLLNTEEGINLIEAPHLLMEFSGASAHALKEGLALVKEICTRNECKHYEEGIGREGREQLWEARHRLFEILVRNHPGQKFLIADVAVPISALPDLIEKTYSVFEEVGVSGSIVGHAGDGNLHVTLFYPPDNTKACERAARANTRLVEEALALGGTSTGEHGVGFGKQKHMTKEHGEEGVNLMRALKATLDPNNILNPGKVLPG